jgi:mycofactocin precursor
LCEPLIANHSLLKHADLSFCFLLFPPRKKAYKIDICISGFFFLVPAMCVEWRKAASMRSKEDQRLKEKDEIELKRRNEEADRQEPDILEEIEIEEFSVDGICGVY